MQALRSSEMLSHVGRRWIRGVRQVEYVGSHCGDVLSSSLDAPPHARGPQRRHAGRCADRYVSRCRGLTLLEVSITVTILLSVVLGTTLVLVPIARQARMNRETEHATAAAQRMLARMRVSSRRELLERWPQGSTRPLPALEGGEMIVNYGDLTAAPLEVSLEVVWTNSDVGEVRFEIATLKAD